MPVQSRRQQLLCPTHCPQQAIDAVGREVALRRGANVLMPILTPTKYREHYTLYEGEAAQWVAWQALGVAWTCPAAAMKAAWQGLHMTPGFTAFPWLLRLPIRAPAAGKPCITDTADECQKCLNARLSMVDKRLKPGVWGDPPSFRQAVQPVSMAAAAGPPRDGGGMTGAHSLTTAGVQAGRALHTAAYAAAAADLSVGPAAGSDVPRTNIGIFGCMNAGKSSLLNRLTRR